MAEQRAPILIQNWPEDVSLAVYAAFYSGVGWRTEPPTVPGWYWARWAKTPIDRSPIEIARVSNEWGEGMAAWLVGMDYSYEFEHFNCWLGPLPVPVPPPGR